MPFRRWRTWLPTPEVRLWFLKLCLVNGMVPKKVFLRFTFVSQTMIADPSEVFCSYLTFLMFLRTHFPVLIPHYCHSLKDAETKAQPPCDMLKYSQDLSSRTGLQIITSGCCYCGEYLLFLSLYVRDETAGSAFIDGLKWVFLPVLPPADVWGGDDICYLSVFVKVIYDDLSPPPL